MYYVLHFFFPFLKWLKNYRLSDLKIDAVAGFTVALVLVPQSMANAQLAGLPAYHGLYAALVPALVGGIWGSSRQMVTGMVAVISLMAAAALEPLAISGPEGYIAYMALLALIVGGIQLGLGVCRMGILVNFLSLPVISGFTNAAAIIIAVSQVNKLFGVSVDTADRQYSTLMHTLESAWNYSHLPSLFMAVLALAIIWAARAYAPRLPSVLMAVAITTAISWAMGFEDKTTVELAQVKSQETEVLVIRFNQQLQELSVISHEIARLEQIIPNNKAAELELQYKINEQRLFHARITDNVGLMREHLRRMLFVSVVQDNGTRLLYVKHNPGIVPGTSKMIGAKPKPPTPTEKERLAKAEPAPQIAAQGQVSGSSTTGAKAPASSSSVENSAVNAAPTPPETATAGNSAMDGPAVRETALPAESFQDGKVWRLEVGNRTLNPAALSFTSGGSVVGSMPSGLPHFSMPQFSFANFLLLLPQALIIAFVGFAESISIAKAAANRTGHRLDANQELVGQGLANIAGGLVLTCPVAGSFSSSAMNISAGARTGLSCAFASLGALITLLFLTPALYYLPQPVLAVIVMRAVGSLVNFNEFRRVWTAQWFDGCIAIITFIATLVFAPHLDYGIAIGVALSLISFFYRSMRPHIAALSCGPDNALRDAHVFGLEECRHIAIVHFQGTLFFANAGVLEDHILWRLETQKELRHIHLVCTGITSIDASGEESLAMLVERATKVGVELSFSGVVGSVAEVLDRTGVLHMVGWENVFLTPREAICAIHKRIQHNADCHTCPLAELFCRDRELKEGYNSDNCTCSGH